MGKRMKGNGHVPSVKCLKAVEFVCLCVVWGIALGIFGMGFLSVSPSLPIFSEEVCSLGNGMKPIDQVVFLLVDAMRADFVFPIQNSTRSRDAARFSYISEQLEVCSNCVAFGFHADAPTITSPRLKAMMTGTIPTYVEAASNFNAIHVAVDNLMDQMQRYGKKKALLGDWLDVFNKTYWEKMVTGGRASLELLNYNIMDRLIADNIVETLCDEEFDFVVAHFLGVDFIGHVHHALHHVMEEKIRSLDTILRNTAVKLHATNKTTLLVVLGDHGMDDTGNHAGATFEEATSVLFAQVIEGRGGDASMKKAVLTNDPSTGDKVNFIDDITVYRVDALKEPLLPVVDTVRARLQKKLPIVPQVDIASTLAILLGVPIPSNNLGRIIPEILSLANRDSAVKKNVVQAYRCNMRQIIRFFDEHQTSKSVPVESMWALKEQLQTLLHASDMDEETFIRRAHETIGKVYRLFQNRLATYEMPKIYLGALLTLTVVIELFSMLHVTSSSSSSSSSSTKAAAQSIVAKIAIGFLSALSMQTPNVQYHGVVALAIVLYLVLFPIRRMIQASGSSSFLVLSGMSVVFGVRVFIKNGIRFIVHDDTITHVLVTVLFVLLWMYARHARYSCTILALFLICHQITWLGIAHRGQREFSLAYFEDTMPIGLTITLLLLMMVVTHYARPKKDMLMAKFNAALATVFGVRWVYSSQDLDPTRVMVHLWSTWGILGLLAALLLVIWMRSLRNKSIHASSTSFDLFLTFVHLYLLVVAPPAAFSVLGYAILVTLLFVLWRNHPRRGSVILQFLLGCLLYSMSKALFYTTGHQNSTLTVDWRSAFAAFQSFDFYLSGSFVFFNTFGADILLSLTAWLFAASVETHYLAQMKRVRTPSMQCLLVCFLTCIEVIAATQITVKALRHEMLWDVFAPNYIFLAIGSSCTLLATIFTFQHHFQA